MKVVSPAGDFEITIKDAVVEKEFVILAFLALSLGKPIASTVGWLFVIESILTLLIPGMILLTDKWNPLGGVPG